MRKSLFLLFFALAFLASQAQAEFYKWTDRDGREFITNDRDKIPAAYRATATPVEVHDERVSIGNGSPGGTKAQARPRKETDRNGRGEAYWHKRAESLRKKIRRQQADRERLVQEARDDEGNGRAPTAKVRRARERKMQKIDRKIAELQHELDVELPDEARKAEALPGWLR